MARDHVAATVHNEQMRAYAPVDVLIPIVLSIAILVIPIDMSMSSRLAAGATILLSVPIGLIATSLVPPRLSITTATAVRITMVIALSAFVPALWVPALVYLVAISAATTTYQPGPDGLALGIAGGFGLAATAIVHGVQSWFPPLFLLVVMLASIREWTAESRFQRAETDRRFDDLIDTAKLFFWEVDPATGKVVSVAGNSYETLGYTPDQLKVLDWFALIAPEDHDVLRSTVRSVLVETGGDDRVDITTRIINYSGDMVTVRQLIRQSPSGNLIGAAVDITELAQATEALRHQAQHDALTGLANRALLTQTLEEYFESLGGGSADGRSMVALVLFDLDGFKGINDTLGHAIGDQVLQILADRFRRSLADAHLCARVGGDEFALVLCDDVDTESSLEYAERLVRLIEDPLQLAGLRLAVRTSVGVALAPDHATTSEELMQRADIALYEAKDSAEKVCLYASTPEEISRERLELSADLTEGLDRGEFELWFQPKVDLSCGRTTGFEGLARWRHPTRGILFPGQFLALLGVSGAYQRFTDQMMIQGIEFASHCHRLGNPVDMAINLGSVSFLDTGLPDRIASELELHGLEPRFLILEVTEDELLLDRDSSSQVFLALEALGVQLAIDDFGTGYSSLSRLRGLQIQEVKIDQSFVQGLGTDAEDWAIVRTIIELSRLLDKRTVAEGIETPQQLSILRDLGCDSGQGFLFDRALPAAELHERIAQHRGDYFEIVTGESHVQTGVQPSNSVGGRSVR